ncbi:hypothetical protein JCM21900_006948 [Sporobolomyces salmonicolor]
MSTEFRGGGIHLAHLCRSPVGRGLPLRSHLPSPFILATSRPTVSRSPSITVTSPSASTSSIPASPTRHRPLRSPTSAHSNHASRPPPRGRGHGNGAESYYMASASGSQTEGADGTDESSESELDEEVLRARIFGDGGFFAEGSLGTDGRCLSGSGWPVAGDTGRGGHVLVQKRSLSPAGWREKGHAAASQKERSWGSALLDTLEGNSHSYKERRRPATSATSSFRPTRLSSRTRPTRPSPDPPPRPPSPPLTIDSIQSTYNPFHLFDIRTNLIFEVVILLLPLLFALFRLYNMTPTAVFPSVPALPFRSLLLFTLAVPFIALFRREGHYFKAPFTDERGYRDPRSADDGVAAALTLPMLLASAVFWDTYSNADGTGRGVGLEGIRPLVEVWEAHGVHASNPSHLLSVDPSILSSPLEAARALFQARYELVLLTALNAVCLLIHLAMARTVFRIERLPKSNTKRFFGFMGVAISVSLFIWAAFSAWNWWVPGGLPISPLEAAATTCIQQSSFYTVSRFARRGFTLGELNTMTAAGNALCLEFWRLTRARWQYKRGLPYIPPTFRSPTPVIAFQAVLIPGAFLSGFLLSPLLVISRHIASKPSHRLKWPTERERHRRLLALGVLIGLCTIVFLFLGAWAGWQLSSTHRLRRPWLWALQFVYYGSSDGVLLRDPSAGWARRWKRLLLCAYWGATIVSAVGGWQTHLVRARRIRMRNGLEVDRPAGAGKAKKDASGGNGPGGGPKKLLGMGVPMPMSLGGGTSGASATTRTGDGGNGGSASPSASEQAPVMGRVGAESARQEKAVHASLNMRRKFFHALAVLMFIPGIAIDPAFTSLAFSVAFTLFTFAEYARYFALYPIGAPLHIFFSEFIDSKDSGPVILSHFYLLTGCAGGLWLEGTGINRFTGVLVLGIGDSLASIVGKLVGRVRWPGTSKTVEGTGAFIVSIVFCAWVLRVVGVVEHFSMARYVLAVTLSGLLEAASAQNDNLVIPIYAWSVVSLLNV